MNLKSAHIGRFLSLIAFSVQRLAERASWLADEDGVCGGIAGRLCSGGYQPFLEKTAGIVRIKIYRFSISDLFWM